MKPVVVFIFLMLQVGAFGQSVGFSLPEKISLAVNDIEIIGQNEEGLLVSEQSSHQCELQTFNQAMEPIAKRNLILPDKNSTVEKILLQNDSLLVFYSLPDHGLILLKSACFNTHLDGASRVELLDTLTPTSLSPKPELHFVNSALSPEVFVWYQGWGDKKNFRYLFYNAFQRFYRKGSLALTMLSEPVISDAVLSSTGHAYLAVGENTARNTNNDFPLEKLLLLRVEPDGALQQHLIIRPESLLGYPGIHMDEVNHRLLLGGLWSINPGNESQGMYFGSYADQGDSIFAEKFIPWPQNFLIQLSGDNPPRKSDGFFNFDLKNIIVRHDGGIILLAESVSVSTESFNNPGYGTVGVTSSLTVNYYHFDEILVVSLSDTGGVEWNSVLRKRQQTEGDGGYYSSFATLIGGGQLHFIYNDIVNGQTNVSEYAVSPDGSQHREDLFNADHKGVMLIPNEARQVSGNDLIIPSIKRSYFQLIRISY